MESGAVQGMADEYVAALHHPLKDDLHLLQGINHNGLFPFETPFHVALAEECVDRATEMLRENPALAHEPNRSGSYPLHVASARGQQYIVDQLLKISPSLCLLHDKEGRTPLHLAALNGKTGVLDQLLKISPSLCLLPDKEGRTPLHLAALNGKTGVLELLHPVHTKQKNIRQLLDGDDTAGGEQILHFCIKNNLSDMAKFLVEKDEKLMKTMDGNRNTVFHLAAATEDTQMLDFLLEKKDVKDVLNVKNKFGYTAFDISERKSPPNTVISKTIQNAGGRGSFSLNWNIWYPKDQAWTNEMNNTLMVVATLIVAVTFQAAINPPGGVWQDPPDTNSASPAPSPTPSTHAQSHFRPGTAIHNNINLTLFKIFMYFDTIAFSAALSIILSLLSGFSLRRRFTTWVMVISMWATLFSMGMAFAFGTLTIVRRGALKRINYVLYSWLGTILLVLLYHCIIFVVCLEDKITECWVNIMKMLGIKKDMTMTKTKKETSDDHKFHHKEMMA